MAAALGCRPGVATASVFVDGAARTCDIVVMSPELIRSCRAAATAAMTAVYARLLGPRPVLADIVSALNLLEVHHSTRAGVRRAGACRTLRGRPVKVTVNLQVCSTRDRYEATLQHELAHAAAGLLTGKREGHGKVWQAVMRAMGLKPERCHSYDLAGVPGLVATRCACKTHYVTARKAAKIARYHCAACKTPLVLAAAPPTMFLVAGQIRTSYPVPTPKEKP